MKNNKTNHVSTDERKQTTYMSDIKEIGKDRHFHFYTKPEWKERLKYTMRIWSRKPTSIDLHQFIMEYDLNRQRIADFVKEDPEIKESWSDLKRNVGCNKRVGTMMKKYDGQYAYRDMHLYEPSWKEEVDLYHREMKTDPAPSTINLKLSTVPSSALVPELPKRGGAEGSE